MSKYASDYREYLKATNLKDAFLRDYEDALSHHRQQQEEERLIEEERRLKRIAALKGKIAVAKITDKGADKYLRVIDQEGESIIGPSNEPQSIASQRDEDETRAPEDTVDDVWMTLHHEAKALFTKFDKGETLTMSERKRMRQSLLWTRATETERWHII